MKKIKPYVITFFLFSHTIVWGQSECLIDPDIKANESNMMKSLERSDAVIVGEFHGVLGAFEIKLELIKKLNREFGYNAVFMEIGKSAAYIYNLFLQTGDITLLERPTMPYSIKKHEKEFWKYLYTYNESLTQNSRLKIYGVDFERLEFLKVLKLLIPKEYNTNNSTFTKKLVNDYDTLIKSIDDYKEFNKLFKSYKNYFKDNLNEMRLIYGDNFHYLEDIFYNPASQENFKERNEAMYENTFAAVSQNDIKKIIGFFGLNHTNSKKSYSLVGKLINGTTFKNVINISMVCKNCFDWQQYIKIAEYSGPYTYQRDKVLMESLFSKYFLPACKFTVIPTDAINDEKVKSFSNYLILLKDQPNFN